MPSLDFENQENVLVYKPRESSKGWGALIEMTVAWGQVRLLTSLEFFS